jgi:predicted Zn-dependent protease
MNYLQAHRPLLRWALLASFAGTVGWLILQGLTESSATADPAEDDRSTSSEGSPTTPSQTENTGDDTSAHPTGPLGTLLGTARRVTEQVSRAATGSADEASVQDLIEAAADGVRVGLAAADEALPLLNANVARKFGDTFRESLLSSRKRITDRRTIDLVKPIWEEVLKAAKADGGGVTITLVEDPELNAFAFVGQNIVLNRGFITFALTCENKHEVIRFALAHELGHIACGHTDTLFRRMVAADKLVPGASVGPAVIEVIVKQTPVNQASEREADCFARNLHLENGWSLAGGKEFLTRVQAMSDRPESGKAIVSLFASHPDEARRLQLLESGKGCDR